jgi:hypothetical protein
VGATKDLLALNIDLASVMQAGRWKGTRMSMRYGEMTLTSRSAMARAAQDRGRDSLQAQTEARDCAKPSSSDNSHSLQCVGAEEQGWQEGSPTAAAKHGSYDYYSAHIAHGD